MRKLNLLPNEVEILLEISKKMWAKTDRSSTHLVQVLRSVIQKLESGSRSIFITEEEKVALEIMVLSEMNLLDEIDPRYKTLQTIRKRIERDFHGL